MADLPEENVRPGGLEASAGTVTETPASDGSEATRAPSGDVASLSSVRSRPPYLMLWWKFRRNRAAMVGLYTLAFLYLTALLAGFFAPYSYENQNHELAFYPPMLTRIRVSDENGSLTRPFVYGAELVDVQLREYRDDLAQKYPIRLFVRGDSYRILWIIESNLHLFGVDAPGHIYLFGSDNLGRDILSRILFGAQVSLTIGIVGIVISTLIAMLIGGVAGYFGGAVDFLSMRTVEVLLALPSLYLILILRAMFGGGLSSIQMYLIIVIILAFIEWATEARVIRGMVLSLKEQDYVIAARAMGFSSARIIIRHILPNTLSFVIVTATLSVPFYILGEVALSFLGVGIQEPEASWGNMLAQAQNNRSLVYFPWVLTPGFFIFVAVMAWNFLGDGLRDAADPRTQG
jgi:peptide/nickel transport system permease protein